MQIPTGPTPGYIRSELAKKKKDYAARAVKRRKTKRLKAKEDNVVRSGLQSAPMSKKKMDIFLAMLKRTPYNVQETCRQGGVSSSAVYGMRRFDPDFARRMDEIRDGTLDELEQIQMDVAKEDTSARQWVLARARRAQWGDKSTIDVSHEVKEYENTREIPTDLLEDFIRERFPQLAKEAEAIIVGDDEEEKAAATDALIEISEAIEEAVFRPLDGLTPLEDEEDDNTA